MLFTMSFFSESGIKYSDSERVYWLCTIRDFYHKLCTSLDQLFNTAALSVQHTNGRSRLWHNSLLRYALIWRALIERRRRVWVASLTISSFLIFCVHIRALPQSCTMFPVVPVVLSVKKRASSCWSCASSCVLSFPRYHVPSFTVVFEKILQ